MDGATGQAVTGTERARERALGFSLAADAALLVVVLGVALSAGSLTLMAEAMRGWILVGLGFFSLEVMRRVHRRRLWTYDFGPGKVEQFANLLVALGLALAAAFVLSKAASSLLVPPVARPAGAMWLALGLGALNCALNALAFRALWRAGRDGESAVMRAQLRSRLGKLVTSFLAALAIAATAAFPGTELARWADAVGALLVAAVMAAIVLSLLRQTLPDLLDRTLDEARQAAINRILTRFFDEYAALVGIRSRQSGGRTQVEVTLGFDGARPFAEVAATCRRIAEAIREELPGAEVVVVPLERP